MNQDQRMAHMIQLYEQLNPGEVVDGSTTINKTSISRLCETAGGPYQRVIAWLEKKLNSLPKESEYLNYLTKEENPFEGTDMDQASVEFQKCFDLMKSRNAKYGDSWKQLRLSSVIDLMIMKLDRCQKQVLDDKAIEVELEDVVNYGIFGLIKIRHK